MLTNDGGNTGSGGIKTDSDTSAITIIAGPVLDLNSTTPVVTGGTFGTVGVANNVAIPNWTEVDPGNRGSIVLVGGDGRYSLTRSGTAAAPITLTTASTLGINAANALTSISFDFYWNNGANGTADFKILYGTAVLGTITTSDAGNAIFVSNGSGATANVVTSIGPLNAQTTTTSTTPARFTITFTTPVTTDATLRFSYGQSVTNGSDRDDVAIDNVAITVVDTCR